MRWPLKLLILTLCGALCTSLRAAAPDGFAAGQSAFANGQHRIALQELLLFVGGNPDDPRAPKALRLIQQIAEAIKREEESFRLDKKRWTGAVETAENLAEDHRRRVDDFAARLEDLARELPHSPSPLQTLRRFDVNPNLFDRSYADARVLSLIEKNLGRVRDALRKLTAVSSADYAVSDEMGGYLSLFEGKTQAALEEWKQALAWNPRDKDLKARVKKLEDALAFERRREEAENITLSGLAAYNAKNYEGAAALFQKALSLDPASLQAERYMRLSQSLGANAARRNEIAALIGRGQTHAAAGRFLDAVQCWVDALALDPTNAEARRNLKETQERLSRPRPVDPPRNTPAKKKPVEPLVIISTQMAEEAYALGLIHYVDGDAEAAEKFFAEALRWQPDLQKARQAYDQIKAERPAP